MGLVDSVKRRARGQEERVEPRMSTETSVRGLDLDALEGDIGRLAKMPLPPGEPPVIRRGPEEFAPKRREESHEVSEADVERAVRTIESFTALPTTEVDKLIAEAEEELSAIKIEAQDIRDEYVSRIDALSNRTLRLKSVVRFSGETLSSLRRQIETLDERGEVRKIEDKTVVAPAADPLENEHARQTEAIRKDLDSEPVDGKSA
jgi:hypothetical protein